MDAENWSYTKKRANYEVPIRNIWINFLLDITIDKEWIKGYLVGKDTLKKPAYSFRGIMHHSSSIIVQEDDKLKSGIFGLLWINMLITMLFISGYQYLL